MGLFAGRRESIGRAICVETKHDAAPVLGMFIGIGPGDTPIGSHFLHFYKLNKTQQPIHPSLNVEYLCNTTHQMVRNTWANALDHLRAVSVPFEQVVSCEFINYVAGPSFVGGPDSFSTFDGCLRSRTSGPDKLVPMRLPRHAFFRNIFPSMYTAGESHREQRLKSSTKNVLVAAGNGVPVRDGLFSVPYLATEAKFGQLDSRGVVPLRSFRQSNTMLTKILGDNTVGRVGKHIATHTSPRCCMKPFQKYVSASPFVHSSAYPSRSHARHLKSQDSTNTHISSPCCRMSLTTSTFVEEEQ